MSAKRLIIAAVLGIAGLSLSGCVEYDPYGTGYYYNSYGYGPYYDYGYVAPAPVIYGSGYYVRYGRYWRDGNRYRHHYPYYRYRHHRHR